MNHGEYMKMKQEMKLQAFELTKIFAHPSKEMTNIPLFAGATFEMSTNKMNFLIGPSGMGKTTLIKILMSIEPINAGEIFFNDQPIHTLTNKERSSYLQKIGYMNQFPAKYLSLELTVHQNLTYALFLHSKLPRKQGKKIIQSTAEIFNIQLLLHQRTLFLSGGELRRLSLACSTIFQPMILFCDEPTAQLDQESKKAVMQTIMKLQKETNCLIVIATHDQSIIDIGNVFEIKERRIHKW